jgi:hypothetical protein
MKTLWKALTYTLLFLAAAALAACGNTSPAPTGDFDLSLSEPGLVVEQGGTGAVTVNISRHGGFNGQVTLSLEGAPDGITGAFSANPLPESQTTLSVGAASTIATGAYPVRVSGTAGGVSKSADLTINVVPASGSPGFTLTLSPQSLTLERGASGSVSVTLARQGGFSEAVQVTLVDPPAGVSAAPLSIPAGSSSGTLTVSASGTASAGSSNLNVQAEGGSVVRNASLSLTVTGDITNPTIQTSHFFLPTGGQVYNTDAVTVETDAVGGVHMVYPSHFGGDAFYAYCPTNCSGPERVSVVTFETDGSTVHNVMMALDASGVPQVLMSTAYEVYYATCSGDCTQSSSWTVSVIITHTGDREVSGEAFALDAQGHPRFIMHSYRAYLGIGQPDPATFYVLCDASCHAPGSWQVHQISNQIWQESQLRFTASDQARLATVATVEGEGGPTDLGAYLECNTDCSSEAGWTGIGLYPSFSDRYVEEIHPAISMALTRTGAPRVLLLGKDEAGKRNLVYFECEGDCSADNWTGSVVSQDDHLDAGLDLALDGQDRPRFVYTFFGNILLGLCDENCGTGEGWRAVLVEDSATIPPDQIPYPYCSYGMWFLRQPSLSIAPDGLPRIGYQARDISGGYDPRCPAGVDMTLSRFSQLDSYPE